MTAITFDTLAFADALKKGGFTPQQAEAQARAQSELFANLVNEKLATKDDILRLELATKEDFKRLEHATKEDIKRLEHATKGDILHLEKKLEKETVILNNRIDELGLKLTIRMGGMLVIAVSILATLIKIL